MSAKGRKRAEAPATEVAAPTVVLASDRFTLYRGDHDLVDIGTVIAPESIDAIVTDPPSGIEFMGKDWDSDKGGRDHWIAWLAGIMRRALVLLKPGGHALVWALPRTSHWTATAVEDAGFEIRDVGIHLFGTGFPKSLDVSKAIDEALGVERAVVGLKRYADGRTYQGGEQSGRAGMMSEGQERGPSVETAPATPEAARFVGIGTALKPAYEGWVLARKPIAILDAVRMVDGCLSSLYASIAVEDSASSRAAQPENPRPDSAVKPAGRRRVTSGASSAAMATSPCASAIDSSLSIVSSWRRTLAECSDLASTSTIGMASSLTTDLQTLNSSASRITAASMLRPESSHDGSMSLVQDVARRFAVLQAKCDAIRLLSVTASAGEQADRRYGSASGPLVGDDGMPGDVGSENWILARKPLAGTVAQNVLAFGTGGLNIDACRIGSDTSRGDRYNGRPPGGGGTVCVGGARDAAWDVPVGRWPAHVTLDEWHDPVLRLRDNVDEQVARVIRVYFDQVQDVPEDDRDVPESGGAKEVLRQDLLCGVAVAGAQREKSSELRTEASPGVDREDEGDQGCTSRARPAAPRMEGRALPVEGIPDRHAERGGTGDVRVDGEGRRLRAAASDRDGSETQASVAAVGGCASPQRDQDGQPAEESGTVGPRYPQAGPPGDREGTPTGTRRDRATPIEACESSIPRGWLTYFENTGRSVRQGSARALDEQSGTSRDGVAVNRNREPGTMSSWLGTRASQIGEDVGYGGEGGASRFFYIAKPARSEKDAGLDHLPIRTGGEATDREEGSAGLNNPRAGSGRTGGVRNHHPTVKSVDLMRWLCRLITPRGGTVLDLFTGSGTTGIAALAEGMKFIGIERDAAFCDVAAGRLAHAACLPTPDRIADDGKPVEAPRQPSLFDTLGATP